MEGFFENSNYKSGWKPLAKDDSINAIQTRLASETFNATMKNVAKPAEDNNKAEQKNTKINPPVKEDSAESELKASEISKVEEIDILKEISKISKDIQALNSMLLEQNEKIDNLLNLIEKADTSGKKSVFGLSWK